LESELNDGRAGGVGFNSLPQGFPAVPRRSKYWRKAVADGRRKRPVRGCD
jgi:hypothetical protein